MGRKLGDFYRETTRWAAVPSVRGDDVERARALGLPVIVVWPAGAARE